MVAKTKTKRKRAGAGGGGKQGRKTVKPIDDPKKRVETFSKRHATLFRAAGHLSAICGAHVAVVAFSPSKRATPYAFGSPSVDTVLLRRRRLHAQDQHGATRAGALEEEGAAAIPVIRRELDETKDGVKAETARKKAVDAVVKQGMAAAATTSWWKADANVIGADALPDFEAALHRLREDAIRRLDPLHAADHPTAGLGAGGATHY